MYFYAARAGRVLSGTSLSSRHHRYYRQHCKNWEPPPVCPARCGARASLGARDTMLVSTSRGVGDRQSVHRLVSRRAPFAPPDHYRGSVPFNLVVFVVVIVFSGVFFSVVGNCFFFLIIQLTVVHLPRTS